MKQDYSNETKDTDETESKSIGTILQSPVSSFKTNRGRFHRLPLAKGNTVNNATKPGTLETSRDGKYGERV